MTDMNDQEISESMKAMSEKLDTMAKMLTDVMRQNAVIYYAVHHEPEKAETMAIKPKPKPAPPAPEKIKAAMDKVDVGKVKALRKAGWKIHEIADDMGITYSKVYRVLHEEGDSDGKQ